MEEKKRNTNTTFIFNVAYGISSSMVIMRVKRVLLQVRTCVSFIILYIHALLSITGGSSHKLGAHLKGIYLTTFASLVAQMVSIHPAIPRRPEVLSHWVEEDPLWAGNDNFPH